jgi:hypothetical protein
MYCVDVEMPAYTGTLDHIAASHMQQLGRKSRARGRVAGNRGDAQKLEIAMPDQRRECVGIVDVGADVGIQDDGQRPARLRVGASRKQQQWQQCGGQYGAHSIPLYIRVPSIGAAQVPGRKQECRW